jgi:hydroxyacylglutathione hydrolase
VLAAAGVPIVVGVGDAHLLRAGRNAALPATGPAGALLRPLIRRLICAPVEPDATVESDLSLADYGVDAHVRVVGGHTPGSCVVRAGEDVVVGDLVRGGFAAGRIRPGHPLRHYFTEDPAGARRALDAELDHRPRRLLTGHGGPLDAHDVRRRLDRVAPR